MLNFLNPYKYYAYGVVFLLLSYAVYALVLEPRLELKKAKIKAEQLEVNMTLQAENTKIDIVDELNKYDANETQRRIEELQGDYNEINFTTTVTCPDGFDDVWVFAKSNNLCQP